jgi:hypothetical protein
MRKPVGWMSGSVDSAPMGLGSTLALARDAQTKAHARAMPEQWNAYAAEEKLAKGRVDTA